MRLFVALGVDEEVATDLLAATGPWRAGERAEAEGWRWTRPEGWHVTLAFLGEVDDDLVDDVARTAGAAARGTGAVTLTLDGTGHFRRRVLHVAVRDRPAGAVARLGGAVQEALATASLPVQQREVTPHLTLARARRRARPSVPELEVPQRSWRVAEARLYASHLHPQGARYEVLERLPLA